MAINKYSVLSSLIWKLFEKGSYQIILFIVTIVLARLLSPNEYGTITLVMVLINLATVFVEGGLNTALIQKKDCSQEDYSTIFYFSLLISCFIYIFLFFTSPYIARFYLKPELISIIRILSIVLFFNAVNSVQRAYLMRNLLFKKLFISSIISVTFSAVVGIVMALKDYGVWSLVAQQITASFLSTVVMWYTVHWRPIPVFSRDSFKTLIDFGWKIFVTNLTITLFVNIRSLIIGKKYDPDSLAYFDKGKQFPSLIMDNINSTIQQVMFPVLSKEQSDITRVKQLVKKTTVLTSYIIYPLLIMLFVLAKPLTILLLTDKWLDIVPFIQIFCIANLFMPIQNVNMEAIKSLGYSNITLKLEVIKKGIDILILFTTIWIDVIAIAWGVALFNFVCIFINLGPCKRIFEYGVYEQIKDNSLLFLDAMIMLLSIIWIPFYINSISLQITLVLLIGIFIYVFVSSAFKVEPYLYIKKNIKEFAHVSRA